MRARRWLLLQADRDRLALAFSLVVFVGLLVLGGLEILRLGDEAAVDTIAGGLVPG